MRHSNISIFIPHLGCPFNCIFCDQYKITGSDKCVTPQDVLLTLNEAKKHGLSSGDTQIAFFGGSFTAIDRNLMIEFLKVAYKFIKDGSFESIRISTRPDCINQEVVDILKSYGVKTVELGVQSLDDDVLFASKRGHTAADCINAYNLLTKNGLDVGMQMMCGLPGDTLDKNIETANLIINLGCKQVRIYPVCVIEGTELACMYKNNRYTPLSVDEAVERCAILYKMFETAGVRVLKIGLHTDSESIAGPFHPAFGELTKSRVFLNDLKAQILPHSSVTVYCAPNFISIAKGNKKQNLELLLKQGYNVNFVVDNNLKNGYKIKAGT